jgi:hypothetical protein
MLIFHPHQPEPRIVDLDARPWMADVDFVLGGPAEGARVLLRPSRGRGSPLRRVRLARPGRPVNQRRGDDRVGRGVAATHGHRPHPPRGHAGRPTGRPGSGRRRRLMLRVPTRPRKFLSATLVACICCGTSVTVHGAHHQRSRPRSTTSAIRAGRASRACRPAVRRMKNYSRVGVGSSRSASSI